MASYGTIDYNCNNNNHACGCQPNRQCNTFDEHNQLRNPNYQQLGSDCRVPCPSSDQPSQEKTPRRSKYLFTLYVILYLAFLVLGAFVFIILEFPEEQVLLERVKTLRQQFAAKYSNVQDDDLQLLIAEVVKANNRGISLTLNASDEPNWNFGQSLFFSGTVVTTIGYGHITPLSWGGKVFCIFYALLGIPLTLVLLSAVVERLMVPVRALLQVLNVQLQKQCRPFSIRILHLLIIVTTLAASCLILPAGVFAYLEPDWDYLDAFYYCFISLTTIGLGDFIPGDAPDQRNRVFYKIATTAYLFAGIICMMVTLAVFYDIPELNLGLLFSVDCEGDSSKSGKLGGNQRSDEKDPLVSKAKDTRNMRYENEKNCCP